MIQSSLFEEERPDQDKDQDQADPVDDVGNIAVKSIQQETAGSYRVKVENAVPAIAEGNIHITRSNPGDLLNIEREVVDIDLYAEGENLYISYSTVRVGEDSVSHISIGTPQAIEVPEDLQGKGYAGVLFLATLVDIEKKYCGKRKTISIEFRELGNKTAQYLKDGFDTKLLSELLGCGEMTCHEYYYDDSDQVGGRIAESSANVESILYTKLTSKGINKLLQIASEIRVDHIVESIYESGKVYTEDRRSG